MSNKLNRMQDKNLEQISGGISAQVFDRIIANLEAHVPNLTDEHFTNLGEAMSRLRDKIT